MAHWTAEYILHVLDEKEWTMNRLASEIGVAASTINRPIRGGDPLTAKTISRIFQATGVDPTPFIPSDLQEAGAIYKAAAPPRPKTVADEVLGLMDEEPTAAPNAQELNEIKIAVLGPTAQIIATINKAGIAKLRAKLDALESMLDD